MIISNIKIKDFRNIVRANVNFGRINILTGKNSSGKSNFLLALGHALSKERDYTEIFSNNVVTYHPGKKAATMDTTVSEVRGEVCYIHGPDEDSFFCVDPKQMRFEKIIDTNATSKIHRLFFTGRSYGNEDEKHIKWNDFAHGRRDELYQEINDQLVYEENFNREIVDDATKLVQISKSSLPNQEEFVNYFSDLSRTVISYVDEKDALHRFVTEKGESEVSDQVAERLKPRKVGTGVSALFKRAKFIFLLADVQRNEEQHRRFNDDLKTYTSGIITNITISTKGTNKGEIKVDSPNGPKDIWTISQGTSILIFFILALNWVKLPYKDKSYRSPNVMIFDEIDSLIHPTLMPQFKEVLVSLSQHVQLFLSTHSPYFIDGFEKTELYLLKDSSSLPGSTKLLANRCNIYDYARIIAALPPEDAKLFAEKRNSELFVDGLIDSIFPHREYE